MPIYKVLISESTFHKVKLVAHNEMDAKHRAALAGDDAWDAVNLPKQVDIIDCVEVVEQVDIEDLEAEADTPRENPFDEPTFLLVAPEVPRHSIRTDEEGER